MNKDLSNKSVAILATSGVEQRELTKPWQALKDAGATVTLVSLEKGEIYGEISGEKKDSFKVDKTVDEVSADSFDALVLPGGLRNPDTLRANNKAVKLVKDIFNQNKPIAAICHGAWLLVEANVLKDRTLTSYPNIKTDIKNAGGNWVDQEVCVDKGLVTSRSPADLEAFCNKLIEEVAEGKHERRAA